MKSLIDDIVTLLQNTTFSVDIPTDNIAEAYPTYEPNFSSPYIMVSEILNEADMGTYTHVEEFSRVSYNIEIYCKQMTISGVPTPARKLARTLAQEIDAAIQTNLGLVRIEAMANAPYDVDPTVTRKVLIYEGLLDLTNDYIYNERR